MAPSTFSTSWNLVESRARWDDDAPSSPRPWTRRRSSLTCDREGMLKLWRWPLSDGRDAQGATRSDPVVELSRAYTPNGSCRCSSSASWQGAAAVRDARLRTSHGVLTACCVNASLSEVIVASPKRVCSHTLRVLTATALASRRHADAEVHTPCIPSAS
ncbi:hypothetical protein JL721_11900 [Aureococcus anophagefferens]|nr:hypothetical protein JL721_11900 [Aureococcus anophagefferens]